jgi:hypothetical protein
LISCADKLDNIRSIRRDHLELGDKVWLRFIAGRKGQEWYYTSLSDIFKERAVNEGMSFKILSEEFISEVDDFFKKI